MSNLKDNLGNISSMRINTRIIIYTIAFVLFCLGFYIGYAAINKEWLDAATWVAMGGFLTGVASLVTGSMFMQQRQKKDELITEEKIIK